MSPLDAKLILDEIAKLNRRFDESYARMERCFSRTLAALEPRGDAVELRVGSPEQFGATQPVVADNWGGLFVENPAFFPATDTTFTVPDAPACITPAPPVSAAAFDPTKENEPEESLPAEYQHRIQELEEKLQDDDIAAPEEALSKRPPDAAFDSKLSGTVGKATSTDKPRLSLMYPLPQTDLDRLYELGRRKLKQVVSPIEPVPVELALHILDDTRVVTLQRATGTHSPRLMERMANLNASYGGGEVEFVGVDMQRIHNGFMPDDPGLLSCVRLTFRPSFIERVLRASAPGGYDGSLDDDPEFGIPHVVALLDRAIGRDGQAPAAAAALRSDAVGAAGGGLLAWEMAVGSAQSTCSTIFLAGDSSFAEVFLVRVTELSITAVSAPLAYTVAPHREAAATYIVLVPVAAIVVFANGGEPGFHLSIIHDASAISAYAFARIMKDVLAHHGEASSPLLLRGHGPVHAYDAASVLYDRAATTPHNWFALQASQHAVEFVTDSIVLAMLLFVDISKEHASPGALQVFEVLLLHADIFCNICIDRELLSHLSLGVTQHQPWPPPDELRLTSCDAELRPTPWPSFNIAKRLSVRSSCGRLWKPPWPIHIRQHVRCPCDLLIQLKPWPARHGQQDGLSCATTTILLLLELLKLKKNWQCALCLESTHLGVTRDCFPDEYSIANLCGCVVLTGCVHMASDINVPVLLLAGELIQEQKQKDHNGCSSNTNIIFTNPQDSVQFCISFTLTNSCSVSWVVSWKPPWLIPLRQQIRYGAVTSAYYRGALGALLLYDIPRRQSFHPIPCWIDA